MSKDNLKEMASAGSTGAGAIASAPSRHAEKEWVSGVHKNRQERAEMADHVAKEKAKSSHIQAQLQKAKELKAQREKNEKRSFSSFFKRKLAEELDMGSIVSQLKGFETENSADKQSSVSYGIEDDKGNFMRVTVRAEQAKEFEMTIARKMADNEENVALGMNNAKTSLAEILFDLQNQFDILDVEFPIIPKDAVYNAGDATVGTAPIDAQNGTNTPSNGMDDMSMEGMDNNMGGMDAGMGDSGTQGAMGDSTMGGDTTGTDTGTGDDLSGGMDNQSPDEEMDSDNVEPFGDETASDSDPASLLKSLVDMLKKQAEAETAKANAAAEQSRATQAEWSAIAANKEVERQEELARVEADVQEKKRREKMAKQYADIAKYNVTQGKSALNNMGESIEEDSFLYSAMLEDAYDSSNSLQKAKQEIMQKYKTTPQDSQIDKNYKSSALQIEMSIINSRLRLANLTAQYNKQKQAQDQQQNQNNQNQNQNQPQNNQPQNNQQPNNQGQQNQPSQAEINQNNGGI